MKKAFLLAVSTAVLLGNTVLGVTVPHPDSWKRNWSAAGAAAGLIIGGGLLYKAQQLMARRDALVATRREVLAAHVEQEDKTAQTAQIDLAPQIKNLNKKIKALMICGVAIAAVPLSVMVAVHASSAVHSKEMIAAIESLRTVSVGGKTRKLGAIHFVQGVLRPEELKLTRLAPGDGKLDPQVLRYLDAWGKQLWLARTDKSCAAAWLPGWLVPADKSFKEAWVSRKKSDGKDAIHGMQLLISAQELS